MLFEAGQPRYLIVANRLSSEIRDGLYVVGDLLPSEGDLCARFGVSRHTVREALRRLQEAGLVSRQVGVGTRVEATSAAPRYVQSIDAIEDFWQYVKETRLHIGKRGKIAFDQAAVNLPDVGGDWLTFQGYRYHKHKSNRVCWVRMFLNPHFAKVADYVGVKTDPVYSQIERAYGVKVIELQQQISAVLITANIARDLNVKVNSPALSTIRRYVGNSGEVLEVTNSVHPADRFYYDQQLRLESPASRHSRPSR
jgi:GntR family transcriptional regulator